MEFREKYLNKVAEITVPFLNDPEDSSAVAEQFIKTFAIKDVKAIAMVRLMYHHLQQFARLTDVAGDGNDLGVIVVFLQPGNDNGGVKTAGICENDFFNGIFIHDKHLF